MERFEKPKYFLAYPVFQHSIIPIIIPLFSTHNQLVVISCDALLKGILFFLRLKV